MQTTQSGNPSFHIPNLSSMMKWNNKKKIYLTNLLSNSMLVDEQQDLISEEAYTKEMINRFAGSWCGDESEEEIMSNIKEARTVREPVML